MDKVTHIIGSIPLFKGLPENQLERIRSIAQDLFYDKGKEIFAEGDDGEGFYIVASGQVKIFKLSPEGKEQILHIYGPEILLARLPFFQENSFRPMR
jgi:CRP/FNR family transcriptional regulator